MYNILLLNNYTSKVKTNDLDCRNCSHHLVIFSSLIVGVNCYCYLSNWQFSTTHHNLCIPCFLAQICVISHNLHVLTSTLSTRHELRLYIFNWSCWIRVSPLGGLLYLLLLGFTFDWIVDLFIKVNVGDRPLPCLAICGHNSINTDRQ